MFAYTGDVCSGVRDSVKLTLLETLPKQNWEVNHILVNPASYFMALRKRCIPCSMAAVPWFPLWATTLSLAHRKCCEAGVNCSFSNPLLQLCIPLLQPKHHCAPHRSTLQNGVTDFYLGRHVVLAARSMDVRIRSNTLTTRGRVDPSEHWIIYLYCLLSRIRGHNQITSHFNSNFRKQMLENAIQSTHEYIHVCGLYHGKAEN